MGNCWWTGEMAPIVAVVTSCSTELLNLDSLPVFGFFPPSFRNCMIPSIACFVPFIFQLPPTKNFLWFSMIYRIFQVKQKQFQSRLLEKTRKGSQKLSLSPQRLVLMYFGLGPHPQAVAFLYFLVRISHGQMGPNYGIWYAFCMIFHVRWIFLTTSLRIPPDSRSDEGGIRRRVVRNPSHMENHTKCIFSLTCTLTNLRHFNQAKYTVQSCRSWKPCEMDLSHNCSLHGGICQKYASIYNYIYTYIHIDIHRLVLDVGLD